MAQICIILQCIFFYISTYIRTGISYNWNKKVFLTWKCDSSGIFWWRGPLVDRVCSRRRRWWKRKGNPVLAPPTYNPPSTSWSEDFLPSYHLVFLTSAENAISFIVAKILFLCQFLSFLIVVFLLGVIGVYLYSPLVTSLRVQWLATTEEHQTMDEVSTFTNTTVQLSCLLKPNKAYTIIKGTTDSRVECFSCKTTTKS